MLDVGDGGKGRGRGSGGMGTGMPLGLRVCEGLVRVRRYTRAALLARHQALASINVSIAPPTAALACRFAMHSFPTHLSWCSAPPQPCNPPCTPAPAHSPGCEYITDQPTIAAGNLFHNAVIVQVGGLRDSARVCLFGWSCTCKCVCVCVSTVWLEGCVRADVCLCEAGGGVNSAPMGDSEAGGGGDVACGYATGVLWTTCLVSGTCVWVSTARHPRAASPTPATLLLTHCLPRCLAVCRHVAAPLPLPSAPHHHHHHPQACPGGVRLLEGMSLVQDLPLSELQVRRRGGCKL